MDEERRYWLAGEDSGACSGDSVGYVAPELVGKQNGKTEG